MFVDQKASLDCYIEILLLTNDKQLILNTVLRPSLKFNIISFSLVF